MANRTLRKVDVIAASCGLFPNGVAMKKDQLARDRPMRRWMKRTRTTLV
jgi:hypothetical protein